MKTLTFALAFAFCFESLYAQTASQTKQATAVPEPTAKRVTERGAHHRLWQWETYEKGPDGRIYSKLHQYTELATGMHYQDANGQWQESQELIESFAGGAVAKQGQYQVIFANNLCSYGAIDMQTPDGKRLRSNVLGLMYVDNATGQAVLIAEVQDSTGELIADNQVLYPNAFDGVKADVRYTYKRDGFEQDIILREQPPAPEEFGMDSATTELQVFTEFVDSPAVQVTQDRDGDQSIAWGAVSLGKGKAFNIDGQDSVSVTKRYVILQGRKFLLEKVPVQVIEKALAELPEQASNQKRLPYMASKQWVLPKMKTAAREAKPMMKLARASQSTQGFVMDYVTVNASLTNYVFQGDMTYYISGSFSAFGTNTFEGGAVLKFATNGTLGVGPGPGMSPVMNWQAGAYRPVIFTAKDDNTVGENIGTGNPTGYYGNPMLTLAMFSSPTTLTGLRICYANTAIGCYSATLNINDIQIVNSQNGFSLGGANVSIGNALLANTKTNFVSQGGSTVTAQNATFSGSTFLVATPSYPNGSYLALTNCVLANVTNLVSGSLVATNANFNGFYMSPLMGLNPVTNNFYPFQRVGAGSYYLTNGCNFLNAGITNINSVLLADIRAKTTYPPIVYSNVTISETLSLSPQAQRDIDTPDLGYHYDPLDYAFGGVNVFSNVIFTAGTAVGWFTGYIPGGPSYGVGIGYGVSLANDASVSFVGSASSPCTCASYAMVQENVGNNWMKGWLAGIAGGGSYDPSHPSKLTARFTRFMRASGDPGHFRDGEYGEPIAIQATHSEIWGTYGGYNIIGAFTNCLFARVNFWQGTSETYPCAVFRNCTFHGGAIEVVHWESEAPYWYSSAKNCAFSETSFNIDDPFGVNTNYADFDYNAFLQGAGQPSPEGTNNITTSNFTWQSGWLGNFYLPTNSPLLNAGNATADQLGLYHFTTQTNQIKEANSTVDIGYHYVAVDAYGKSLDHNADGVPDYIQDENGNSMVDNGESPWMLPPVIDLQPDGKTVNFGSNVTFAVTLNSNGIPPFHYQWFFNISNEIVGATSAVLILTNIGPSDIGFYSVVITNMGGSTTSSVVALDCIKPLNGMISWWRAEGNANDSIGTNNGTLVNGAAFTNGILLQSFHLNGLNQHVEIADSQTLKPTNITVEAWVRLDVQDAPSASSPGWQYIVFKKNTRSGNFEGYALCKGRSSGRDCFYFGIASSGGQQVGAFSTTTPQTNVWYHIAGTYDGANVKLYVSGALEGSSYAGFPLDYGTRPIFIGTSGESWDAKLAGSADEVSIYNRALSSNEISTIFGNTIPLPDAPTNLAAIPLSSKQIELEWDNSPITAESRISVSIERATTSGGDFEPIGLVDMDKNLYVDTNLLAETQYYYRVRSINAAGYSGYSSETNAITFSGDNNLPLDNLRLWLRADSRFNQINNNQVSLLRDMSGQTNHATQVTTGNRPTYVTSALNGLPVVHFDGTNSFFGLPNFMTGTTQAEEFVVLRVTTNLPSSNRAFWRMGNNNGYNALAYPNTSGQIVEGFGSTIVYNIGVPAQSLDQYHVFGVSARTGAWTAWINGILQGSVANNTYGAFGSTYQLGRDSVWGAYFAGDVAEVLMFSRTLTAEERQSVNLYLNGKYGLAPALPATPTNLMAQAISTNQISLTWNEVLTNAGATQLSIERKTGVGGTYAEVARVGNTLSYIDTNLVAGTTYYYRVRAINLTAWSDYSNESNATALSTGAGIPLSDLRFWLKADSGLAHIGTNTPVNFWADQSGNTNNATQTSGGNRPIWLAEGLNGRPVVHFDGTNSFLRIPNILNATTQAEEFIVWRATANLPNSRRPFWRMGGAYLLGYPDNGGHIIESFANNTGYDLGVPSQSLDQYHLYQVAGDNVGWNAWMNGALLSQKSVNTYAYYDGNYSPDPGCMLGRDPLWGGYFAGDVAEMLVFSRTLTAGERQAVNIYLNGKYGLVPGVKILTPTNNVVFTAPASIPISASVSGINAVQVEFFIGATRIGVVSDASYGRFNFTWNNAVISGALTVRATDSSGLSLTSAPVNVTIDYAPNVVLASPANYTVYPVGSPFAITAEAADSDGSVTNVQFFENSTNIGADSVPPYSIIWSNAVSGTNSLTAVATDNYGITSTSSVVNVIYDIPPVVSITNPVNNARFIGVSNINVNASATDADGTIASVQFFQGTTSLGTATNPPYSLVWSNVSYGTFALTAVATDNMGLTTTSAVVNATLAGIKITAPTNNVVLTAPGTLLLSSAVFNNVTTTQVQYFSGSTNLGTVTTAPYNLNWTNIASGVYQLTSRATDGGGLILTSSVVNVISDASPATSDRDGDGVTDWIEYLQGRNPLVSGTVNDTNNWVNLKIYTPLQ